MYLWWEVIETENTKGHKESKLPQIPAIQYIANQQDGIRFPRQLCIIVCIFRMVSYQWFFMNLYCEAVTELSSPVHLALALEIGYCQHAWPRSLLVKINVKLKFK